MLLLNTHTIVLFGGSTKLGFYNAQPLRDSLQLMSRLGIADAAASVMLPMASDRPGPLEAGHRRARSLILTPTPLKKQLRRARNPPGGPPEKESAPAAPLAEDPLRAVPENAPEDLMLFTPEPVTAHGDHPTYKSF